MKDYKHIEHMRNLNDSLIWERMKRCYDYGYEDRQSEDPVDGRNEIWEILQKITADERKGGYPIKMLNELFGSIHVYNIVHDYTPQEVIAKIKAYEDKQKQDAEIKVGDEVKTDFGSKGVVITNKTDAEGNISVLFQLCSHVQLYPKDELTRTGRTFSQIAEVLAELRGAE